MKRSLTMPIFLLLILSVNGNYKLSYANVENEHLKPIQSSDHIISEVKNNIKLASHNAFHMPTPSLFHLVIETAGGPNRWVVLRKERHVWIGLNIASSKSGKY